ncbi:MAG: peptide chain release factor N(5)-glutamine methyltransferase [Melioribacteraceae bacterium]|nr:peptide chain release factor N(5)-glutamine methyltransferase [Melioribacteraceae bacterium]
MTVLEAIEKSTAFLEKKGIESARINAELLLADILECKRLDLYLQFEKPLANKEIDKYRDYISRRGDFEPLQYVIGNVEFYGYKFKVSPDVLIPRQETETLIETVIDLINNDQHLSILDIGTGSGNIPICIAKGFKNSSVISIDISENAIKIANQNVIDHELSERVKIFKRDIFVDTKEGAAKFDVIISNPPYVSITEYKTLQKEIINFEPKNAVTDNNDGYLFYNRICQIAPKLLNKDGYLFFETGEGQSEGVKKILEQNGFRNISSRKDYLDIERVIFGQL